MAQPEKQHFSCRGQSLSWLQESCSAHDSGGCRGRTFGHLPGLSERGGKGQQGQGEAPLALRAPTLTEHPPGGSPTPGNAPREVCQRARPCVAPLSQ